MKTGNDHKEGVCDIITFSLRLSDPNSAASAELYDISVFVLLTHGRALKQHLLDEILKTPLKWLLMIKLSLKLAWLLRKGDEKSFLDFSCSFFLLLFEFFGSYLLFILPRGQFLPSNSHFVHLVSSFQVQIVRVLRSTQVCSHLRSPCPHPFRIQSLNRPTRSSGYFLPCCTSGYLDPQTSNLHSFSWKWILHSSSNLIYRNYRSCLSRMAFGLLFRIFDLTNF